MYNTQNILHVSHANVLSSLLCQAAMEDITSVLYIEISQGVRQGDIHERKSDFGIV